MYGETIFLDQVQHAKLDKKNRVIREKAYETIGGFFVVHIICVFLFA